MAAQIEGLAWRADAGPLGKSSIPGAAPIRAMSSIGTSIVSFNAFFAPASTTVTGR
jgi:hypothetical protein